MARSPVVQIVLNPADYEALSARVALRGVTVSAYLRELLAKDLSAPAPLPCLSDAQRGKVIYAIESLQELLR